MSSCAPHECNYTKLLRPHLIRTVPPVLLYYGSDGEYDYYKQFFCRLRVKHSNVLPPLYMYDFKGWKSKYSMRMVHNDHFIGTLIPFKKNLSSAD